MSLITAIKLFLGYKVCPLCGSPDITESGFEGSNLRYNCKACGTITYIDDRL